MKALDAIKHADAITEMIDRLMEIDPMRKGYYQHLRKLHKHVCFPLLFDIQWIESMFNVDRLI